MEKPMRAVLLAGLLATAGVGVAAAQTVGGSYTVTGTNPNGSTYAGTAEITRQGSNCRIAWNTGSTSEGACMVTPKALAAFYKLGADFGLVMYDINPDGSLTGYWTIVNKDGVGGETLKPKK
jgi:hypothetical protein